MKSQVSKEQQLSFWVWDLALRLRLHAHTQPHPVLASPTSGITQGFDIPDLHADPTLHPLQKSVTEHGVLASFLALIMTKYGHG